MQNFLQELIIDQVVVATHFNHEQENPNGFRYEFSRVIFQTKGESANGAVRFISPDNGLFNYVQRDASVSESSILPCDGSPGLWGELHQQYHSLGRQVGLWMEADKVP